MENKHSKQNFNHFILATALVLACFLGYVFHPVFYFGYFIFLILLAVNPLLFGYISKRPMMSFLVGFLPLFLMFLYRLPMIVASSLPPYSEVIVFIPGALLLGISGFFAARAIGEKKYLNLGISALFVLAMITFYLYIFMM